MLRLLGQWECKNIIFELYSFCKLVESLAFPLINQKLEFEVHSMCIYTKPN